MKTTSKWYRSTNEKSTKWPLRESPWSQEVKENALVSEGRSCRPETIIATVNRCVSWPLSVKHAAKITFAQWKRRTPQSIIYPAKEKKTLLKLYYCSRVLEYAKIRTVLLQSIENKGEMTFKSNVCKAWFAFYSEVQIGFWTVGRILVVWWVVLPIR